jgi:hypothetical protein
MFRRIEWLIAKACRLAIALPQTDEVGVRPREVDLGSLGLICHFEMVKQVHYGNSIARDGQLSDLFKDVLFPLQEESRTLPPSWNGDAKTRLGAPSATTQSTT